MLCVPPCVLHHWNHLLFQQGGQRLTENTWDRSSVMFWSTSFDWQIAAMSTYQLQFSVNLHSMPRSTPPAKSMALARSTLPTRTVHRATNIRFNSAFHHKQTWLSVFYYTLQLTALDQSKKDSQNIEHLVGRRGRGQLLFVSYKTNTTNLSKIKTKIHKFTNAQTILVHFVFQTAVTDQYKTQIECRK